MIKDKNIAKHYEGEVLHGPKEANLGTFTMKGGKPASHMKSGKVYFDLTLVEYAKILLGPEVKGVEIILSDGRRMAA